MPSTNRHVRLTCAALGDDAVFLRMSASEALGRLSRFEIAFLSLRNDIDPGAVIGQNISVTLDYPAGGSREFNGIVTTLRLLAPGDTTKNRMARYEAIVHPRLWLLTRASHRRFFHLRTAPQIVAQVVEAYDIDFRNACTASYPPLDHCVQYRETDFDFVSRLMEREGMHYFFEHAGGKHTLVLADSGAAHRPVARYESVPFQGWDTPRPDEECVYRWHAGATLETGRYEVNDYDFEKASVSNSEGLVSRATRSAPYDTARYLMQEHLSGHVNASDGERLARVNVEIHQTQNDAMEGRTTARGIAAGGLFRLRDHPGSAQNRQYLVIENQAEIVSDAYVSTSDPTQPLFDCHFKAIRSDNTFRSPRVTPVPRTAGPQTAVVIGPPGEEILTDKYGRVKVQFHWEQLSQTSGANRLDRCWVRVAQGWANRRWGAMCLPRVGQEVLVEFIEGDPDRPVIVGAVYNSTNMPPYELPAHSAVSTLRSQSTKGGNGFNEVRFDDRKGAEQMFFHAERDHETWIKHDALTNVAGEKHLRIGGSEFSETRGARNDSVLGGSTLRVGGPVSAASMTTHEQFVGEAYSLDAGAAVRIKAGAAVEIEAGATIALRAGASYILIGPETIEMSSFPIPLGPGVPPVPLSVPPAPPRPPRDADDGARKTRNQEAP
ncbi:type VI secretion system Vgr family protein [Paraburkholderia sp. J76]|uniref:type VI secretion system Vgr family protein n=1 Tax=Paraburkholderia sp. J76 TaxID=2805439 RepID=UPI002ABDCCA5|nr:type VI secretion system tip protein TssI/VgrG [Paraburkholderia sp. J76]